MGSTRQSWAVLGSHGQYWIDMGSTGESSAEGNFTHSPKFIRRSGAAMGKLWPVVGSHRQLWVAICKSGQSWAAVGTAGQFQVVISSHGQ
jgi:hypothetical protein